MGNRCFVDRGVQFCREPAEEEVNPTAVAAYKCGTKPKPERVSIKFGKARLQITSAKKVNVKQEGEELVLRFEPQD